MPMQQIIAQRQWIESSTFIAQVTGQRDHCQFIMYTCDYIIVENKRIESHGNKQDSGLKLSRTTIDILPNLQGTLST